MALFKADNMETLASSLTELLVRRSVQPFIAQLQAIWDQQETLNFECHCDDLKGHPLTFDIKWVVIEEVGQLNYNNVIVVVPKLI
jgi:two-component system CheB/CheR fusion protein